MAANDVGQRGKTAERLVKKRLEALSQHQSWAFERLPDARAGSFKAALCDFLVQHNGLTLLEVKEVDHAYRLPHGNFSVDQVARQRRWKMAGTEAVVLIYFKPIKAWRIRDIDYFVTREGGSWSFKDTPTFSLEELLC